MPKESTNLKLKLYNAVTDAKDFAVDWFNNIFDYTNSNWVKIDDAYKEIKDNFNNYPTKDGTGATGNWDINANSAVKLDTATAALDNGCFRWLMLRYHWWIKSSSSKADEDLETIYRWGACCNKL